VHDGHDGPRADNGSNIDQGEIVKTAMLLVPGFAGTFILGSFFGQEVQTFCDDCESTYIGAEEIQEYLEVASVDQ
jgi:hypothetical protein